ncbi:hypothetical protein CkaCkLH20_06959 [Colletotrichum karsti]|uniref:AAA+ ATPase domain-containing protein n=1 Tax=Colletotrichum karsti TaxID=1095194 RepID=A0A9P6LJD9_9PEZI|nr:uncharacterized protein CkaCkLH20_06959 [Colletotrichum karsti]KAF9875578.1 hypothetical protein CkaCkLH20_06959 [Colletotrichum karsti]
MKIASQLLESSLKMVADCKLDEIWLEDFDDESWEMEAPYNFLFHHRKKLQEFASCDPTRGQAVKHLLDYLEENFGAEFAGADDEFMRGVVTEASIEKLFRPNQTVVSENDKGVTSAYILDEWPVKKANQLLFSGWHWAYGGRQLDRKPWYSKIDLVPFKGNFERPLSKLQVVPAQYADENLLAMLQRRGEKFWSMRNQSFVSYNGWDQHHDYFYSKERFMVDMSTYSKLHPRPRPNAFMPGIRPPVPSEISDFDDNPRVIRQDEDLDERQVMILPAHTYGYSLREKKWVSLSIAQTESIAWNKKAFDRLVLQPDTKRLLRALINVRMSNTKKMDDLVSGKGNGLIMLLHGSPGTGKSLTAESVAEYAEKPLYRVTCGDIGTEPTAVEKYLETVLYLGKIWDCVLLLDEADVFLEERTVSDLTRNSLVSIFLRVLEYYEGIIILTSNRVGTFDEAFQSRIRVALHYEPLTKKFRKAIWSNFFEMLTEDQDDINVDIRNMEGRLEELADYKMNGRQIRNIVLTARQLAMEEGESLEWKHLSQVLTLSRKFNEYLEKVKGHSNEDWAVSQQIR